MFNVSCIVSGDRLTEVLNRLHQIVPTVNVTPVQSANIPAINGTGHRLSRKTAVDEVPIVKVKRHKRHKPQRNPRDGKLQRAAQELIGQYGTGPFALTDLLTKAVKQGLSKPTVYRAIRLEIEAGRLVRLTAGQYQRKGASFAHAFGLSG